ncbi:Homeobox protein ceh-20 [Toxocara canis]|uniref:Homeobox protein ceh-20 n=1 Tax=Toxocara canis TaxID=6265 RepID=A0A0B2V1B2_TOXCA|nr:Homeobox protein ceh-20 [Toxocara canis]
MKRTMWGAHRDDHENTSMTLYAQTPASTQQLLEKVYRICEQDLSEYTSSIMHAVRSNRYFGALFELLCQKKKQMSVLANGRYGRVEDQQMQFQMIDKVLEECMGTTQMIYDEFGEEEEEERERAEQTCDRLLAECRADFAQFTQQLQAKCVELDYAITQILQRQRYFRPITQADIDKCRGEIRTKVDCYQRQLKQLTCQNVMMLRSKYLDARRKRRNFSKDATRILSEFFFSHLEHPYPNEDAKAELARKCNLTVNQSTAVAVRQSFSPLQSPVTFINRSTDCRDPSPLRLRQLLKGLPVTFVSRKADCAIALRGQGIERGPGIEPGSSACQAFYYELRTPYMMEFYEIHSAPIVKKQRA